MKRVRAASQAGFTLIELLTVLAILGILAAIAVQAMSTYRAAAYDARAMHDLANAVNAEEAYYATFGTYVDVPVTIGPANIDIPGFVISATVSLEMKAESESFEGSSESSRGSGKTFRYDSITDTFVND